MLVVVYNSCNKKDDKNPGDGGIQTGSFFDSRDGRTYKTVKIGSQWWMAENLNYNPGGGNWAYDNIESNAEIYGMLYTWESANVVCPDGWELPSDDEWNILTKYLGGESVAGGKMKEQGTTHWKSPNLGATNSSGFTALPGGIYNISGTFTGLGKAAYFWSSTQYSESEAWRNIIMNDYEGYVRMITKKGYGLSVRCIKD